MVKAAATSAAGGGPDLRQTGIPILDALPWGEHICLFYETGDDLLEAVGRYFEAGLSQNEYCYWMMPDEIDRDAAIAALRDWVPHLDAHIERGAADFTHESDWFHGRKELALDMILDDMQTRLGNAIGRGFAGIRGTSSAHWREAYLWPTYRLYEEVLGDALSGLPILILSTHELREASAAEIANAARVHQFSILLRQGRWELLQTPWLTARQPPAQAQVAGFAGADLLTARERETLARLAEGASNKAVARALGISPRTVEFHRANIMRKLHARSFAELLARVHTGG